jgi:pimeloyl-ACP methyl ester carboxylesterase
MWESAAQHWDTGGMEGSTRFVDVGGHKTRVLEAGRGDPVLVLHGWGGRIESMAPVIACLAERFGVRAIDLPGFGESPIPKGAWGTADYAEFISDLSNELGIERARFVGHSFGAKVSIYLAATHPELVEKLVLTGASGLTSAPSMKVRLKRGVSRGARFVGRFGTPGERLRSAVYKRIASQDYQDAGELKPILVKVVNEDIGHMLPRIRAATLLVWGTEDAAVPVAHARTMEELIPDAGLVLFEGAGHFAYLDESQRFCRIVRHFFDAPLPS